MAREVEARKVAMAYEIDRAYAVYVEAATRLWERARKEPSPDDAYLRLTAPYWQRYVTVAKAIRAR